MKDYPGITETADGRYHARPYGPDGRQRGWSKLCATLPEALAHMNYVKGLVANRHRVEVKDNPVRASFATTWAAWRPKVKAKSKARATTIDTSYRLYLEPFFGPEKMEDITVKMVEEWLEEMETTKLVPSSLRNVFQVLVQMLTWSTGRKRFSYSELIAIKGLTLPKIEKANRIELSPEEVQLWVEATPEERRISVILGRETGMRISEVLGLCVERVTFLGKPWIYVHWQLAYDVELGGFYLKPPKAGTARDFPMPQRLHEALSAHLSRFPATPRPMVHVDERGKQTTQEVSLILGPHHTSSFSSDASAVAASIGLNNRRSGRPVRFHDLRHHFGTEALQDGASIPEVAAVLGDSVDTVARVYAGVATRSEHWMLRRERAEVHHKYSTSNSDITFG